MSLLLQSDKIFVAGSRGMVGSAICRLLAKNGYTNENKRLLISSHQELDLRDINKLDSWFSNNKPDIVICAAAKVGGILANNSKPVDFLLENLKIQNNLIETSWKFGVKRFLFLGSSCIYPKEANQPIKEEYLLSGPLEATNQWYAISKIAGLKLCEAYRRQYNFDAIALMPTNLYGPNDNYDLKESHVMAALIRKFYEAKHNNANEVICWGSGKPLREFLFVDDFAEACLYCLRNWSPDSVDSPRDVLGHPLNWLNIGSGFEIEIKDLAEKISKITNYKGKIIWDKTKPDGTYRKKLCSKNINALGWAASTDIEKGINLTLDYFENDLYQGNLRF